MSCISDVTVTDRPFFGNRARPLKRASHCMGGVYQTPLVNADHQQRRRHYDPLAQNQKQAGAKRIQGVEQRLVDAASEAFVLACIRIAVRAAPRASASACDEVDPAA